MIKKNKISQEDFETWKNYIKNPKDIVDKEKIMLNKDQSNSRFKFDLHGYTLHDANSKVREIILSCIKNNYNEILLITGKGIHSNTDKDIYVSKDLSKLKYSVPEYINSTPEISIHILSIANASKEDGGEGALILKLKKL